MHGRQLGRELGFPTANMEVADADTIESGVYESYVEIDGVEYKAMSNLGSNPSVGGGPRHLETHIFDFSGDLYGRRLRVELRRKIRDERKFDSLEELQLPDRTGSQLYFEFGESAAMTVRRFMPFFGRRPCLPLCGFDSLRRESVSQCGRREPTIRQEIMYN